MQNNQYSQYFDFQNLPVINNIDQQMLAQLDTLMTGNWIACFQGITALRCINKFYPQYTSDAMDRYMNVILNLINNGKTQILKNSFSLIKEVFSIGRQFNIQKCVFGLAGLMIKKSGTELGKVKEMATEVLTQFSNNCGYDISFIIVSEYCHDKNIAISEISIKLFARLIQNIGLKIAELKAETLQTIMKSLTRLLSSKRSNIKVWARQICMFIYNTIGNQNYLQLMNYVLLKEEIEIMINELQTKKNLKSKEIVPLANILKQRKTMLRNNNQLNPYCNNTSYTPNNQNYQTNMENNFNMNH